MIQLLPILTLLLFTSLYQETERKDVLIRMLPGNEIVLKPSGTNPSTELIQEALDSCAGLGGGTVRLTKGTYYSGTIMLKSNVSIRLDKGVSIIGSSNYADYRNDAFFYGSDLKNISISGEGIIDGVDCYNPKGEEGFRGPHCIRLINCTGIVLKDITIKNSANWAINCRYCSYGNVTNVTILGGHDGLHTRFCDNFRATGCDFRTGDDAFAGNDNRDFFISDCKINTSCNGFRMGCMNLTVRRCTLWGPGEYIHKIQNRTNMLSAFVHFSPPDQKPKLKSGNWVIEDVTVKNVDNFYIYNFKDGLWQTGQPATDISFENVNAAGLLRAFYIDGGSDSLFSMKVKNSSFSFRTGNTDPDLTFEGAKLKNLLFVSADGFNLLEFNKVAFEKPEAATILNMENGNSVTMKRVTFPGNSFSKPYKYSGITGPISILNEKE